MSSAESQSDKPKATVRSAKRFPKKTLVILAAIVIGLGLGFGIYLLVQSSEPTEEEQVQEATAYTNSVKTESATPKAKEQYEAAKAALEGKNAYAAEDIGALVQAALTADAAKQKAEAKRYAAEALILIKKDSAYAEAYPHIVVSLKEIAQ